MKKLGLIMLIVVAIVSGIMWVTGLRADSSQTASEVVLGPEKVVKAVESAVSQAGLATEAPGPLETAKIVEKVTEFAEENVDDLDIKVLREQMAKERDIQQQIKLRRLELERANLQLEQEKALAEVHQIRKANQGVTREANGDGTTIMPDIKVIFIGVGEKVADAIISINGTNFTVKPGDTPQENVLVKSISNKNVVIVINGIKEISLVPNLME